MELDQCKERITTNLQKDIDLATANEAILAELAGPPHFISLRQAIKKLGNPRKTLLRIHDLMGKLLEQLEEMLDQLGSGDERRMEGEGLEGKNKDEYALR